MLQCSQVIYGCLCWVREVSPSNYYASNRHSLLVCPCAVMIFHVVNAWQETPDLIKMFACCFKEVLRPRFGHVHCVQKKTNGMQTLLENGSV